jgi:hypothetical protein
VRDAEAFEKAVKALPAGGSAADLRALYDAYFAHLTRDGRDPFGSGLAPERPDGPAA